MGVPAEITVPLARQLIENYGQGAEEAARERAEALAAIGNREAAQIWVAVCEILQRQRSSCQ
ncbi:MAG: hypothetical protein ACREIP_00020 [Alphaproteobacteria bacterium]